MARQTLERQVFELSREIEFFTEKELAMQIGHGEPFWYVGLIKELIDTSPAERTIPNSGWRR